MSKIYVAIDLADERYCDDCPCHEFKATVADMCSSLGVDLAQNVVAVGTRGGWLRPQACKDASAAIGMPAVLDQIAEIRDAVVDIAASVCDCEPCTAARKARELEESDPS